MTVGERIRALRQSCGMSQTELAIKINASKQTMYKYENGVITNIPSDKIELLAQVLGTTPAALMGWDEIDRHTSMPSAQEAFYDGDSYTADHTHVTADNIRYLYDCLDAQGRSFVGATIAHERVRVSRMQMLQRRAEHATLPYYSHLASAGTGEFLFDDIPTTSMQVDAMAAEHADFVIGVTGDSMEPTFYDGDDVLVKKTDTLDVGDIGIFIKDGSCLIKELGKDGLISHNKAYAPIKGDESLRCVGKVLGKI